MKCMSCGAPWPSTPDLHAHACPRCGAREPVEDPAPAVPAPGSTRLHPHHTPAELEIMRHERELADLRARRAAVLRLRFGYTGVLVSLTLILAGAALGWIILAVLGVAGVVCGWWDSLQRGWTLEYLNARIRAIQDQRSAKEDQRSAKEDQRSAKEDQRSAKEDQRAAKEVHEKTNAKQSVANG